MKAKPRVSALRGRKPDDLAANRVGFGRISLRCASMRRKIALDGPGIRGMSAQWSLASSRSAFFDILDQRLSCMMVVVTPCMVDSIRDGQQHSVLLSATVTTLGSCSSAQRFSPCRLQHCTRRIAWRIIVLVA
jgi:hypothetical protein